MEKLRDLKKLNWKYSQKRLNFLAFSTNVINWRLKRFQLQA